MVKILVLGGGGFSFNTIQVLTDLGYYVICIDKDPNCKGFHYAHESANIDFSNYKQTLNYALKIKPNIILALSDIGTITCSKVCKKIGIPYHSEEVSMNAFDKGRMRNLWKLKKLDQPKFFIVKSREEINNAIKILKFPVILKPCRGWGNRGVSIIKNEKEIEWSFNFLVKQTTEKVFIIEELIDGLEVSVEGLIQNKDVQILTIADKTHFPNEKLTVTSHLIYPSKLDASIIEKIKLLVTKASKALGLSNGALHGECIVNKNGVYLVELAARPGGGHIFSTIVNEVTGINMPEMLVNILLNKKINIKYYNQKSVCYHFFEMPQGKYNGIENFNFFKNNDSIIDFGINLQIGKTYLGIEKDADRPGFIITRGEINEEALINAEKLISKIKYK